MVATWWGDALAREPLAAGPQLAPSCARRFPSPAASILLRSSQLSVLWTSNRLILSVSVTLQQPGRCLAQRLTRLIGPSASFVPETEWWFKTARGPRAVALVTHLRLGLLALAELRWLVRSLRARLCAALHARVKLPARPHRSRKQGPALKRGQTRRLRHAWPKSKQRFRSGTRPGRKPPRRPRGWPKWLQPGASPHRVAQRGIAALGGDSGAP